jgi:hypothetical protein
MRCKSNAAQPRWLWVMATIPELPGGTAGVTASHPAFAAAIARHGQLIFVHTKNNSALSHRLELRLTASFAAAAFDGLLVRADLCLDTISFSGFNTAMQALGQGAPLVAYEGAFMRGCLASGTLRQMGLHELVATNDAEFVAIATTLARDVAYRATIRARIMAETPKLYDDRDAVEAFQEEIRSLRK